jgi:hypothetical protein
MRSAVGAGYTMKVLFILNEAPYGTERMRSGWRMRSPSGTCQHS